MSIFCKIFGHKITNNKSYIRYFQSEEGATDNLGWQHLRLFSDCERCDKKIHFGNIHAANGNVLPQSPKDKTQWTNNKK